MSTLYYIYNIYNVIMQGIYNVLYIYYIYFDINISKAIHRDSNRKQFENYM